MEAEFWKGSPAVETVPGSLNGRPAVKGSRVAADTIWECAELVETPEETTGNYGLSLLDVLQIRSYYDAHQKPVLAS